MILACETGLFLDWQNYRHHRAIMLHSCGLNRVSHHRPPSCTRPGQARAAHNALLPMQASQGNSLTDLPSMTLCGVRCRMHQAPSRKRYLNEPRDGYRGRMDTLASRNHGLFRQLPEPCSVFSTTTYHTR